MQVTAPWRGASGHHAALAVTHARNEPSGSTKPALKQMLHQPKGPVLHNITTHHNTSQQHGAQPLGAPPRGKRSREPLHYTTLRIRGALRRISKAPADLGAEAMERKSSGAPTLYDEAPQNLLCRGPPTPRDFQAQTAAASSGFVCVSFGHPA